VPGTDSGTLFASIDLASHRVPSTELPHRFTVGLDGVGGRLQTVQMTL